MQHQPSIALQQPLDGCCQLLPDVEVESVAHSNVVQMPMALCQATGEVSPARRAGRGVIVTTW